jgi:hypothetical protein
MRYEILKGFKGSQDGRFAEDFKAGSQAELSDYLAEIVVREGWARPVGAAVPDAPENKAIVTDGKRARKAK